MSLYYFDCMTNGVLYPDAFGVKLSRDEIEDQAKSVLLTLLEETVPNKSTILVSVTVRSEQDAPVYVVQGVVNGVFVERVSASTDGNMLAAALSEVS